MERRIVGLLRHGARVSCHHYTAVRYCRTANERVLHVRSALLRFYPADPRLGLIIDRPSGPSPIKKDLGRGVCARNSRREINSSCITKTSGGCIIANLLQCIRTSVLSATHPPSPWSPFSLTRGRTLVRNGKSNNNHKRSNLGEGGGLASSVVVFIVEKLLLVA